MTKKHRPKPSCPMSQEDYEALLEEGVAEAREQWLRQYEEAIRRQSAPLGQ